MNKMKRIEFTIIDVRKTYYSFSQHTISTHLKFCDVEALSLSSSVCNPPINENSVTIKSPFVVLNILFKFIAVR